MRSLWNRARGGVGSNQYGAKPRDAAADAAAAVRAAVRVAGLDQGSVDGVQVTFIDRVEGTRTTFTQSVGDVNGAVAEGGGGPVADFADDGDGRDFSGDDWKREMVAGDELVDGDGQVWTLSRDPYPEDHTLPPDQWVWKFEVTSPREAGSREFGIDDFS